MTIRFEPSMIGGAGLLTSPFFMDARGGFTKTYGDAATTALGEPFPIREVYWSRSHAGVVRGLHFQCPPASVAKIVFVTAGHIRDVVLDLRPESATFGEHVTYELSEDAGAVVVPRGCAHGFEVIDGPAITCYLQDGPFDQQADAGLRWDSAGISWGTREPIVSDRDRRLPAFDRSRSPFSADV